MKAVDISTAFMLQKKQGDGVILAAEGQRDSKRGGHGKNPYRHDGKDTASH